MIQNKLAVVILLCSCMHTVSAQKKFGKPIEVSGLYSIAFSDSRLSNTTDRRMTSPPYFNTFNYGFKIERSISKDTTGLFMNMGVFGMDLTVSGRHELYTKRFGSASKKTVIPHYEVVSLGVKKVFKNASSKAVKWNVETGIRAHFAHFNWLNPSDSSIIPLDSFYIFRTFTFDKEKKFTLVPYIGAGLDVKIMKKAKVGVLFWIQNGFTTMFQYNYTVKYRKEVDFKSKSTSTGLSWGAFVFVRVFSF